MKTYQLAAVAVLIGSPLLVDSLSKQVPVEQPVAQSHQAAAPRTDPADRRPTLPPAAQIASFDDQGPSLSTDPVLDTTGRSVAVAEVPGTYSPPPAPPRQLVAERVSFAPRPYAGPPPPGRALPNFLPSSEGPRFRRYR